MLGTAMLTAAATAIVVWVVLGAILLFRLSPKCVLLLLLALVTAVLLDEAWRIHSHHGLLHASIVYSLVDGGAPPESPFLAGVALGYPYGQHRLLAEIVRLLPVAPSWLFAATNWIALLLTGWVLDSTARSLGGSLRYRSLVLVLALFGTSPFARGPLQVALQSLGAGDGRSIPLLKFATVNGNQLGILFFVLALAGVVRLFADSRSKSAIGLVALGWVGSGFLYPTLFPAVVGCSAAAAVAVGIHGAADGRGLLLRLGAVAVGAGALVIPWILSLTADSQPQSLPRLDLGGQHLLRAIALAAGALLLPLALLFWQRSALRNLASAPLRLWLSLCVAGLVGAFLCLHLALESEYKFLLVAQVPLAFLVAAALERVLDEKPIVALGLVALIIVPGSWWMGRKLEAPWPVRDPATTAARSLRHAAEPQRELHAWIKSQTPRDAILVDTHLSLPAFARRPLFVGTDLRPRFEPAKGLRDGVGLSAKRWLTEVHGRDPVQVERRLDLVRELLSTANGVRLSAVGTAMQAELPGRAIYVVVRERALRSRLIAHPRYRDEFQNEAVAVFRVVSGNSLRGR